MLLTHTPQSSLVGRTLASGGGRAGGFQQEGWHMGSKPSRTGCTTVVGADKVCAPPAERQCASAPPTPQRPDGAPRLSEPLDLCEDNDEVDESVHVFAGAARTMDLQYMPSPSSGQKDAEVNCEQTPCTPCAANEGEGIAELPAASLDIPLEEVLTLAVEAFGQIATSLSSPKWDRRVQALKGVGTVLRCQDMEGSKDPGASLSIRSGSQPKWHHDPARCFRAACLVLHIAMKDKVLPVLFAAHELYRFTFEYGTNAAPEVDAQGTMNVLLQHLLIKLGELNIRLHESARAGVAFSASCSFFGLGRTLSRLREHVADKSNARGLQRMRVHAGVLDTATHLLRKFPGRQDGEGDESDACASWTPADAAPFIQEGIVLDELTGSRVQQAAVNLAVVVVETLGRAALDPYIKNLPEHAKELLASRLDELDDFLEDGDHHDAADGDLPCPDGLCVLGVGIRPAPMMGMSSPLTNHQEERFMDEILEEAGLVFEGQALKIPGKTKDNSVLDEDLTDLGLDPDELKLLQ